MSRKLSERNGSKKSFTCIVFLKNICNGNFLAKFRHSDLNFIQNLSATKYKKFFQSKILWKEIYMRKFRVSYSVSTKLLCGQLFQIFNFIEARISFPGNQFNINQVNTSLNSKETYLNLNHFQQKENSFPQTKICVRNRILNISCDASLQTLSEVQ